MFFIIEFSTLEVFGFLGVLQKQLWRSQRDNEILKKATALFAKDNTVMERFFRSLKTEKLNYQSFTNHHEVVQNVESYIYFYNYKRIHSAIGYLTPA